jgi:hypothetical protein
MYVFWRASETIYLVRNTDIDKFAEVVLIKFLYILYIFIYIVHNLYMYIGMYI